MPKKISTQKHLNISEIKDDAVILKDGSLRAVILVSSLNFALKSEEEQKAIVGSYVSFLNNIDFTVQIVIQSRKLHMETYIDNLKKIERELTNDLLRMQIAEYRQFINALVEGGNIMTKKFYVVVPYEPLADRKKSFFSRLKLAFAPVGSVRLSREHFLKRKHELDKRAHHILTGLYGMSLSAVRLDTQGLIELYYNTYNPVVSENEELADMSKLRVEE